MIDLALRILLALSVGFLVGRTRVTASGHAPRPGIRDCMVTALSGAVAGLVADPWLTASLALGITAVMLVARSGQMPRRKGITTELAVLACFALGVMAVGPHAPLAAAAGIGLAAILSAKASLHHFAFNVLSRSEFDDTLKFLALIFLAYPLLPTGSYGPFGFFDPQKIWLFMVVVSGVSFIGYFLTKFLSADRGVLVSGLVGGLVSTTACTVAMAQAARSVPAANAGLVRAALLANTVMFPRMALVISALDGALAQAALPMLLAMVVTMLVVAVIVGGRQRDASGATVAVFRNPFALKPALVMGAVFAGVLFAIHAGRHYLGEIGQRLGTFVGGLVDVDAVTLSLAVFHRDGDTATGEAVLGMLLAITANAVFKSVMSFTGGTGAFAWRVATGLLLAPLAGAVTWWMAYGG